MLLSACAGAGVGGDGEVFASFPGGSFPAGTCPGSAGVAVPLRMVARKPLVPAQVNDRPAVMLLDTGSNLTLVARSAVERLDLSPGREAVGSGRGISGTVPITYSPYRQFTFGPLRATDGRMFVIPLDALEQHMPERFDGLLGADLLGRAELDIDLPRGTLTLYPPACRDAAPPFERPPLRTQSWRTAEGYTMVRIFIGGQPVSALVDTGAGTTVISRAVANRLGLPAPPAGAQAIPSIGIGGESQDLHPYRVSHLQVGEEVVRDAVIIVSAGLPAGIEAVLGADYMMQRRTWMSLARGRILFERPAGPGPIMSGTSTLAAP